jgi:large repetitive protein
MIRRKGCASRAGQARLISAVIEHLENRLLLSLTPTTTAVESTANPAVYGQDVTFTATVNGFPSGTPTGTVDFDNGATLLGDGTLTGGVASFTTSSLLAGQHSITATYVGSGTFEASERSLTQTIDQDSTTAMLGSSSNFTVFGQEVTFTATVSANAPGAGTPTGTVNFFNGQTLLTGGTLSGGEASFTTSALPTGTDSISAIYLGDSNFITSTSSARNQSIAEDNTVTTLTPPDTPAVFGQLVTFTATVSPNAPGAGTPTGTVSFFDGETLLGSGTLSGGEASLSTTSLSLGAHSIEAVYAGNGDFNGSTSSTAGQAVEKDATFTVIGTSANPSVFGQLVTFTATVNANAPGSGTPTGSVVFEINSTPQPAETLNNSGVATLNLSSLALGSSSISVAYEGGGDFIGSASPALSQIVHKDATTTTVSPSANPSDFDQQVTFTATVSANVPGSGTPTGTVNFDDGATLLGSATLNGSGVATVNLSSLPTGANSITAIYDGDSDFNSSTSSALSQTIIGPATQLVFTTAPQSAAKGNPIPVVVAVEDQDGNIVTYDDSDVTIAIASGTSGAALGGTLTVAAVNGTAKFEIIPSKAGAFMLAANDGTLVGTTSASFSVGQAAFAQKPSMVTAGTSFSAVVNVERPNGNTIAKDDSDVRLTIAKGPAGAILGGMTTVLSTNGVATFADLLLNEAGIYKLTAIDGNLSTESTKITVNPAAPATLAFVEEPTDVTAGEKFSPRVSVSLTDAFGNLITDKNVKLSIASGPSGAVLEGTLKKPTVNGTATFGNINITEAGTYTLTAKHGTLTGTTSNSFVVNPAAAATLAFVQQPTPAAVGVAIAPAITVDVDDEFGNLVTNDDSNVTLVIKPGTGPDGAILEGTATVAAQNGIATFSDVSLSEAGTYQLKAEDGSLTRAKSAAFTVSA